MQVSPHELLNAMKDASLRWYRTCRSWHALNGPAAEAHRDALYRTVRSMNAEIEALERELAESSNDKLSDSHATNL